MISLLFSVVLTALREHTYRLRKVYGSVLVCVGMAVCAWYFLYSPSERFPSSATPVEIVAGSSVSEIAASLQEQGVIRSPEVFIFLTKLFANEFGVQAGTYLFAKPYDVGTVVYRVTRGMSDAVLVQVTFPEGSTVRDMKNILVTKFEYFDTEAFTLKALAYEGYLFPDTYTFTPRSTIDDILVRLQNTFNEKTREIESDIRRSGHSIEDIVIMASLLEREARTEEEKRIIAGILWNRIEKDMPLQVDAVFGYIKNKDTYHPSFEDLEIDSPYNTYRNKGLPPGPINNPGLESLRAAATPLHSEFLYYLTGRDGKMRYAKTFEEHKANRAKYLD